VSFVNSLKPEELRMLRGIVKEIHFKHFDEKHGKMFVTNYMLDQVIDNIGPDVAECMIKVGVDKGLR
jgi:hypothetical protein